MATPNVTFSVPKGFAFVAEQLNRIGFRVEQDLEAATENCPPDLLGWRSWSVEFPNGESAYILECSKPEPEILFNMYQFKDGRSFRSAMLELGVLEHWDGVEPDDCNFWFKQYFKNYRHRLGDPKLTNEN